MDAKSNNNMSLGVTTMLGVGALSCVEDSSTTCYAPPVSPLLSKPKKTTNTTTNDSPQTQTNSNTLGIYCLVGDLSEGTNGASPVMCMSGQKCKVSFAF